MTPRVIWIHNFATHYTAGLFEQMCRRMPVRFLFYSKGGEWYWLQQNRLPECPFPHETLRGLTIGGTRIVPGLVWRLWWGRYDVAAAGVDGKFALPVTYLLARLRGRPFVLYTGIWTRVQTLTHRLAFPFLRHVYRHADSVVVYGEHVRQYLLSEGVRDERIFVEPHAADNRLYGRRVEPAEVAAVYHRAGLTPGTKLVLYIGRLEQEKGLSTLLQAFALCAERPAALVMAGAGAAEAELRAEAARLGIESQVRWVGYLPPVETPAFYAAATVFVLPSVTTRTSKEAWGLVVNEAFNQGVPAIVTDVVGAAAGGLVEDGVTGWVVPEAGTRAMAEALRMALRDEAVRAQRGAAARERVQAWSHENAASVIERAVRAAAGVANDPGPTRPEGLWIVIPVHNRAAFTRACLAALAQQTVTGFKVIVIDDGSTDGTAAMVREEFPAVRLLRGDGGLWWTGATNLGVSEGLRQGATHLLTLNDDTVPAPDFVESLVRAATAEPAALIGAYAIDAASGHPVYGGETIHWATASYQSHLGGAERRVEVTHFPGRGLLIPAAVFRHIGLFDGNHFPQTAADYDFTHRARRAGYRIYCDRQAVLHVHPEESGDASYRRTKGWANYYRHLFDIKGGGNLRVFFWYAVRNCPWALLPLCLPVGLARRVAGYPLEWLAESRAAFWLRRRTG
jgi:glycosyltransferase involved in cell wall biosynthesis/GT2 family glycosyltransferase